MATSFYLCIFLFFFWHTVPGSYCLRMTPVAYNLFIGGLDGPFLFIWATSGLGFSRTVEERQLPFLD